MCNVSIWLAICELVEIVKRPYEKSCYFYYYFEVSDQI
jgi:hypothetical protein